MQCTQTGLGHFASVVPTLQVRKCYHNAKELISNILEGETTNLRPATPLNVRQAVIAQYNGRVSNQPNSPTDGDGVVMKNFLSASTIGAAFSITARLIRLVVCTAFLIFSLMIAAYQQSTYGNQISTADKHSLVAETLKRYSYEWVDLAVSVGITVVGLINTFGHDNISLDRLRDYYFKRTDDMNHKDRVLAAAQAKYKGIQKEESQTNQGGVVQATSTPSSTASATASTALSQS